MRHIVVKKMVDRIRFSVSAHYMHCIFLYKYQLKTVGFKSVLYDV